MAGTLKLLVRCPWSSAIKLNTKIISNGCCFNTRVLASPSQITSVPFALFCQQDFPAQLSHLEIRSKHGFSSSKSQQESESKSESSKESKSESSKESKSESSKESKPKSIPESRQESQSDLKFDLKSESKSRFNFLNGFTPFSYRKKEEKPKKRRVPKLILIQNPITWLMIKIDFSVLRNIWDPIFEEKEFKYGTRQAISRVTQVISDGQYAELNGLLTKAARLSLLRELERNWNDRQRSLLALKIEDIQISSPRKVYFIRIADKKYCDVDMAFLALKWVPINSIQALIFTEIFARFHREYTPHCIPEWTIAYFKVTRFEVIRR